MISRFFIHRPVFSTVLSIIITLAGLLAMQGLPISQYPDVVPPEVVVQANYPGASAEDIAETVAAPLEQEINGVQDMLYMTSTSSDAGTLQISVTFAIGTDPDQNTINVNNRVQAATSQLPQTVRDTGVQVNKRSSNILTVLTLFSPNQSYDTTYISNYALINVIDQLKRVEGVGDARLFGSQDYSMRIWLDPNKMARYELTPTDVQSALREQNSQFAAGSFGSMPNPNEIEFTYTASTEGRFSTPEQFEQIILRSQENGQILRLEDVARVELGAQSYGTSGSFSGNPAVPFAVYLSPGANSLATVERIRTRMEELGANLPDGLEYEIPFDTTKFVDASIKDVEHTFIEAIILVVLVVFLFLQNWRATLIPLLAIPVSVIGTFAGMFALGFSINLLTLFGLILAIGIVVDDAIIVIENVERIMTEEGKPPKEAALKAMEEVSGPVIAVVLVLSAVFVPVGFLGGLSGQMYRQFAITIAVSVGISGLVALTLTPALCAVFLKPREKQPNWFFRKFNAMFDKATGAYLWGVDLLLRRVVLGLILFVGVLAATWFVSQQVPGGLVPQEDQGYIFTTYKLPPAASLQRTEEVRADVIEKSMEAMPAVADVVGVAGYDFLASARRTYAGIAFLTLKDWGKRTGENQDSFSLVQREMALGAQIPEAQIIAFNPPPIIGLSTTGGFEGYLQSLTGADFDEIREAAGKVVAEANQRPELSQVRTTLTTDVPRYRLDVDREKAKSLGVPIDQLFATLQATFGSLYVNQFTYLGRNWQVNIQSDADYREKPEDLADVFVRSESTGEMIPVSSLVSTERTLAADVVQRFNIFPAAKIMGSPAPGFSSGQANQAIQQVVADVLDSSDYQLSFTGTAYQEETAAGSGGIAVLFGMLMVFLILAAQYEKWTLPLAVITAVPFAALGAFVAVWLRGVENNLYFSVGLLVLIGLSAKNAILIVEFAVIGREQGKTPAAAAYEAAKLRFRPIVMTSLAFILGCVPLALASGASANSRVAIGTAVIGGMLAATFFAILFVPLFYDLVERGSSKVSRLLGGKKSHEHQNDA
ncbi:efflux RND transporter permease subunit [Salinisphaera orenii]|uniref:Efflux pump membrane transporter n=1 Tax=Salinisphaera orenii YIM 95161 TaxID=1051139 RepID=A0A423PX87_9GAMM|nr:multidrug efflux RND transporter permease subunit [Salinisphaera halophila]ROO30230.1 transporter [Salinisphaera halophila YIM 95161]